MGFDEVREIDDSIDRPKLQVDVIIHVSRELFHLSKFKELNKTLRNAITRLVSRKFRGNKK